MLTFRIASLGSKHKLSIIYNVSIMRFNPEMNSYKQQDVGLTFDRDYYGVCALLLPGGERL